MKGENPNFYLQKYKKYKSKYIQLKRSIERINTMTPSFYFIHTTSWKNLEKILEDNCLAPSIHLDPEHVRLGGHPLDCVFMHIFFDELKNIINNPGVSLLLSPEIINHFDIIFNKSWVGEKDNDSLFISKKDSINKKSKKIRKMYEYLEKPENMPTEKNLFGWHGVHEVLICEKIPLDKFLIGIICPDCSRQQIKKLKRKYPTSF